LRERPPLVARTADALAPQRADGWSFAFISRRRLFSPMFFITPCHFADADDFRFAPLIFRRAGHSLAFQFSALPDYFHYFIRRHYFIATIISLI